MRSLLSFHKLGSNNRHGTETPRVWLASQRLDRIGFGPGARYRIDSTGRGLALISDPKGPRIVSSVKRSSSTTPIIDINSMSLLGPLAGTPTLKLAGSYGRIELSPSLRSLQILRRLKAPSDQLRVVELFCGGGTMSAAINAHPQFKIVAGVEMESRYSDLWQAAHPDACLISGDLRDVHPMKFPASMSWLRVFPAPITRSRVGPRRALRAARKAVSAADSFPLCFPWSWRKCRQRASSRTSSTTELPWPVRFSARR